MDDSGSEGLKGKSAERTKGTERLLQLREDDPMSAAGTPGDRRVEVVHVDLELTPVDAHVGDEVLLFFFPVGSFGILDLEQEEGRPAIRMQLVAMLLAELDDLRLRETQVVERLPVGRDERLLEVRVLMHLIDAERLRRCRARGLVRAPVCEVAIEIPREDVLRLRDGRLTVGLPQLDLLALVKRREDHAGDCAELLLIVGSDHGRGRRGFSRVLGDDRQKLSEHRTLAGLIAFQRLDRTLVLLVVGFLQGGGIHSGSRRQRGITHFFRSPYTTSPDDSRLENRCLTSVLMRRAINLLSPKTGLLLASFPP